MPHYEPHPQGQSQIPGVHRQDGSIARRDRRSPSPGHGKTEKTHAMDSEMVSTDDRVYRNMLIVERARRSAKSRNHGNASPQNAVERDNSKRSLIDCDQYLVQREDLEKMRLNKAIIHNMKTSICALSRLTQEMSRDVSQYRTATNLWKNLKAKFSEMNHKLYDEVRLNQGKFSSSQKKRKEKMPADEVLQQSEIQFPKLVLPKIETGSRPSSTPSIIEMQETLHRENSEKVNKSKMSHIKKIARKRSQEKALKDVDLEPVLLQNTSSESLQSNKKHRQKVKKENRFIEKRHTEMEDFQDQYILPGKEMAVSGNGTAHSVGQSKEHKETSRHRNSAKQNKGNQNRKVSHY